MYTFSMIAAASLSNGIGLNGKLPWSLPPDLRYFQSITTKNSLTSKKQKQNVVIMGRKTWESIPQKYKPLDRRINIVLSRKQKVIVGCTVFDSLQSALEWCGQHQNEINEVFVAGGEEVYKEAIFHPQCFRIYLTRIFQEFDCDSFFPQISPTLYERYQHYQPGRKVRVYKDISYRFECYDRKLHEECQYLSIIEDILQNGNDKGDRTGTGVFSKFGYQMKFNLRDAFPLLTTKRVFWKGVAKELLWFVKGSTNSKLLSAEGVKIWDSNGSKEFLKNLGLGHREEGDLGPVYGFQWRHFGAEYMDCNTDYHGKGIDQLQNCIETIKKNPTDRRIILSAWNPSDLKKMALPPCHLLAQFYVSNGELSCQMYQRSCDMGLGVPFNIASYALLTCMMAKVCNLKPGDFIHTLGDAHVYKNHVDVLKEQLKRNPRPFPTLTIKRDVQRIDDFSFDDFELSNYNPHKSLKMKMAV